MHDTFLFNKVSESIQQICKENKIKSITRLTIVVNENSHINSYNMKEHLFLHNKDLINTQIVLDVIKDSIEESTAIIKEIQGDTFE